MKKAKKRIIILIIIVSIVIAALSFLALGGKFSQISIEDIRYDELKSRFQDYFIIPYDYQESFVSAYVKYPVNPKTGGGGMYNSFTIRDEYAVMYSLKLNIDNIEFIITGKKEDKNFFEPTLPTPPEIEKKIISFNGNDFECEISKQYNFCRFDFARDGVDYRIQMNEKSEEHFELFGEIISRMSLPV